MPPSKGLDAAATASEDAPRELQLRHVVLFHRHGDRTPVLTRLGSKVHMDEEEKEFWRSRVVTAPQLEELNRKAKIVGVDESDPPHIRPAGPEDWPSGVLTAKGVEHMTGKGRKLRQRYESFVSSWLGEDGAKLREQVHVLSSSVPRCQISVQCLLRGMFEDVDVGKSPFLVRTYARNVLAPAHPLQVFNEIEVIVSDDVAKRSVDDRKATEKLGAHIRECIGVPDDQPTPWTAVRDMLTCREAHGRPFPQGITPADVEQLHAYDAWLWHVLYSRHDFCFKSFRYGVREVYDHVKKVVDGQADETKLAFFSAHDNSIVALVGALQLQIGGALPEYGTVVALEVYQDPTTQQHFVKALFEDQDVTFAGHEHELLCPFSHFEALALKFLEEKQ